MLKKMPSLKDKLLQKEIERTAGEDVEEVEKVEKAVKKGKKTKKVE
jgi:hypothetical protein